MRNQRYQTDAIAGYYRGHRRDWEDFYPSERWVVERVVAERGKIERLLDVGCAAGGFVQAIGRRYGFKRAVGIDINAQAVAAAREAFARRNEDVAFYQADICDCDMLDGESFDIVTAFGVVDWNTDAEGMLAALWKLVAPDGHLVLSLRLTTEATVANPATSYQPLWFGVGDPPAETERAQYTVLNAADALRMLHSQQPRPEEVIAYGFWGPPSPTARTPFKEVFFSVFAVKKPSESACSPGRQAS